MRLYTLQAGDTEFANMAAEIKLRAERKVGGAPRGPSARCSGAIPSQTDPCRKNLQKYFAARGTALISYISVIPAARALPHVVRAALFKA